MIKNQFATRILLALMPLIVGVVFYLLLGHRIVTAMYYGKSLGLLNNMIEQQKHVSLIHYLRKADALTIMLGFCYILTLIVGAGYWLGRENQWIRRVIGVVVYVAFLAVIAELSARGFFWIRKIDIGIYRNYSFRAIDNLLIPDRQLGFKLAPSDKCYAVCSDFEVLYETNELGLRERPVEPSSGFRILFLGDSVTFGWGVPYGKRFTERVGAMIPGVQTINAGVPGYGLHQMQRWLELHGEALNPDLVICSLIFQDLNRAAVARIPEAEPLHVRKKAGSPPPSRGFMPREEVVAEQEPHGVGLTHVVHSGILAVSDLYAFIRVKVAIGALNRETRERQRFIEQARRAPGDVHGDTLWLARIQETTGEIMDDFAALLTRSDIRGMVVNISPFPIVWLEPLLEKRGITYLDLSPVLAAKRGITFEIDPHYNSRGHAVIAEGLTPAIIKHYRLQITTEDE